jgi:transposase
MKGFTAMTGKNSRSIRYEKEFKLQAAKLIVEGGYTYARASRKLGVSSCSLRNWTKAFRASGHLAPEGTLVPQAEELKQLRKDLAQARVENEILKKAAAYFAKESL